MTNKENKKWAHRYASASPYGTFNYNVANTVGLKPSVMLMALCSIEEKSYSEGRIGEDGSFYATIEKIKEMTTLSRDDQSTAINKLVKLGYITVERRGTPVRRRFTINAKLFRRGVAGEFVEEPVTWYSKW